MITPFDLIKKGAKALVNEGKMALDKIAPDVKQVGNTGIYQPTTSGLIKNTILGLPKATRDTLAPTRGYTEKELIDARPNLSQTVQGAPKVASELVSGLGELANMIPGYSKALYKITNNKVGDTLAKGGAHIVEYGKPKNVEEAQAMRIFDVGSNFIPFGGSIKNVARASKIIGATEDAVIIARELKGLGLADDVIKDLTPKLVKADGKMASDIIQEATKPKVKAPLSESLEAKKSTTVYRASDKPFDPNLVGPDGVYVSPSENIAGFFDEGGKRKVEALDLSSDAKVLEYEDIPKELRDINDWDEYSPKVAKYARDNGYDAVRSTPETELTVVNPEKLSSVTPKKSTPINEALDRSISRQPARAQQGSPLDSVLGKTRRASDDLSTGEVRSLERLSEQAAGKTIREGADEGLESFEQIIRKTSTPVNKKIGIIDAVRTPENVFRKMGYSKEFNTVRKAHEDYVQELPKNIDKITEIAKNVTPEENVKIFKYLDGEAIDLTPKEVNVAEEVKKYLSEWADRLGLPQDKRISNYITHIFDDQLVKKEFDEDLAKIIADKIPGSVYDPFLLSRLGAKGYKQDFVAALDAYTKRATRKVHMDPALDVLSNLGKNLEKSQFDYIKKFADRVNMRPSDFDTAVDNSIKNIIGYKIGQRPLAKVSRLIRQMAFRGMIGANVGSALRNLSQGVNTYAKLGEKYTAIGYAKMATQGTKELKELGIFADNFVTDRALSATKKTVEKLDKGLFFLFDTAEKVNRGAAYYGAKSKALSEGKTVEESIEYGKKIVRDTQFQYSAIDTPLALQDDMTKIFLQFLSYPIKQTEFIAGMAKNKEYMGIARYVLGGLAFTYTVGSAVGMEPAELIPFSGYVTGEQRFGTPPSLKLPVEIGKAALDTPDKYGNARDTEQKLKDVGNAAWGVLPGGIQLKKTLQGREAAAEGASYSPAGQYQFPVGGTPAKNVQAYLFGKYAGKDAKAYFDKKEGNAPMTEADKLIEAKKENDDVEKKRVRKIWIEATSLKNTGKTEEAEALVDSLSDEDYEIYKEIRSAEKAKTTKSSTEQMYDTVIEAQKLKESGDLEGAQAIVDALTDEEYEGYVRAKKKLDY